MHVRYSDNTMTTSLLSHSGLIVSVDDAQNKMLLGWQLWLEKKTRLMEQDVLCEVDSLSQALFVVILPKPPHFSGL